MHALADTLEGPTDHARRRVPVLVIAALGLAVLAGLVIAGLRSTGAPGVAPAGKPTAVSFVGLKYLPDDIEAGEGTVRVRLQNDDAISHTFTIFELDVDVRLGSGESTVATFEARRGTYEVVCTIPGHIEGGMTARLRVVGQ